MKDNNGNNNKEKIFNYVKCFFGLGDYPGIIKIVLPMVEQKRTPSLICNNYPLYSYEIPPDDVFTALRVYSMLVFLYGDRVQIDSCNQLNVKPSGHLIMIGSPVTNHFTSSALENQYFHFGEGKEDHDILGKKGERYSVKLDGNNRIPNEKRNVIKDYALITKRSHHGKIEVVMAGCRAYGQMALWNILESMDFYEQVLPKIGENDFQIIVEVNVNEPIPNNWKILKIEVFEHIKNKKSDLIYSSQHKPITWLHLSDLHFDSKRKNNIDIVLERLLDDVKGISKEHDLVFDFIVVTGDLAYSGNKEEYVQAKDFFVKLLNITNLTNNNLFVVPGNHDVDINAVKNDMFIRNVGSRLNDNDAINEIFNSKDVWKLNFKKLENYGTFVNILLNSNLIFNEENFFYVKNLQIRDKKIGIMGLNSVWSCGSEKDKTDGILIGEQQVRTALNKIQDADICIALLHHPYECIKIFDRLKSYRLLYNKCDFILHGHLHETNIRKIVTPDTQKNGVILIDAGSSYTDRSYKNKYNCVQIYPDRCKIILRLYSDQSAPTFWAGDTTTYENGKRDGIVFLKL